MNAIATKHLQAVGDDWNCKSLGDVCRPVGGGTPSRAQPNYWNGNIQWASVKDFSDDALALSETQEHITQEGLESSASTLIPSGTPVICTRMAVGRCAVTTRPTAINQDLKALPLSDDFELDFFIRLLRFHAPDLDRVSIGSTVRGITTKDLLKLPLRFPQKPHQARIAAVLYTADEAIAKTETVIAKLRQVRTGLIHDLLTYGLDENGRLRDPIAHPEQFKDSPLGRVAIRWTVKTLGSICRPQQWPTISTPQLTPVGFPVFGANGQIGHYPHFNHEHPTVAITCRGATCGNIHITPPCCYITGNAMALDDLNLSEIRVGFLAEFLRKRGMNDCITGSAQPQIIRSSLLGMLVPIPPAPEQDAAIEILTLQDAQIRQHQAELTKLQSIKSGLMDDLLTGRVRVPEIH
jgi:type I restriction enzyme S subunit